MDNASPAIMVDLKRLAKEYQDRRIVANALPVISEVEQPNQTIWADQRITGSPFPAKEVSRLIFLTIFIPH